LLLASTLALCVVGGGVQPSRPAIPMLRGRVVNGAGGPVAGAKVSIIYSLQAAAPGSGGPPPGGDGGPAPLPAGGASPGAALPGPRSIEACNNPFATGLLVFSFSIPSPGEVLLRVRDRRGQAVRTLASGRFPAGANEVVWDGTADDGAAVPNDVYRARWEHRDGDALVAADVAVLRNSHGPVHAGHARTDEQGSFAIPLGDLPIGETIHARDLKGAPLGDRVIAPTLMVCAEAGAGAARFGACVGRVELGDLSRDVDVTVDLP